jgi:hypothetical protein
MRYAAGNLLAHARSIQDKVTVLRTGDHTMDDMGTFRADVEIENPAKPGFAPNDRERAGGHRRRAVMVPLRGSRGARRRAPQGLALQTGRRQRAGTMDWRGALACRARVDGRRSRVRRVSRSGPAWGEVARRVEPSGRAVHEAARRRGTGARGCRSVDERPVHRFRTARDGELAVTS